jgi:tetratricopeptide (TPR) repeat protein
VATVVGVVFAGIQILVEANSTIIIAPQTFGVVTSLPNLGPSTATPTPAPSPRPIATAQPDEILILVERFVGGGESIDAVRTAIWGAIEAADTRLDNQQLHGIRPESLGDGVVISRREEALEIGRRYDASLVVYGSFDPAIGLNINFAAARRSLSAHIDGSLDRTITIPTLDDLSAWVPYIRSLIMVTAASAFNLNDRPEDALRALTFALEGVDTQSTTWRDTVAYPYDVARGYALLNMDRYTESIAAFNQALELYPQSMDTLNSRAQAEIGLGQYDVAEATYREVLDIDPTFSLAHLDIAILYRYSMGKERDAQPYFESAIELLTEEIDNDPDNYFLLNYRSVAYQEVGDLPSAIEDALEARAFEPFDPATTFHLATLYYQAGEFTQALDEMSRVERAYGDNASFFSWRSATYYSLCLYEKARTDHSRYMELAGLEAVPGWWMAEIEANGERCP